MPKWTNEQLHAINESGKNIIVSAGAGSGKTAVLTERVITLLKKGIKINELLILTFTENAAKEMKERIRKEINNHEDLLSNLDYLDAAYITTFDSFALSTVKKYHYLINVSKNLKIADNGSMLLKKKEIMDNLFESYYKESNQDFLSLINDLTVKDDEKIKSEILNIINKISLKPDLDIFLKDYLNNFYNEKMISTLKNEYMDLIYNIINKIEDNLYLMDNCNYKDDLIKKLNPIISAKKYDDIKACDLSIPRLPNNSDDIKPIKNEIDNLLKSLKELLSYANEKEIDNSFLQSKCYVKIIIDIINKFNEKIRSYKHENDLYEFIDIELMAINLLKDNKSVCDELKSFYKEIMIDEYQDTSDIQEAFINLIENNNVYMVGDTKQSIYAFRNANMQIFKHKYDNYKNGKNGIKIDLLKNFRSRDNILNAINEIFCLIMDDDIGGANYQKEHQMVYGNMLYDNKTSQNYDLDILTYEKDNTYTNEEIECFIIANDIMDKINNHYQIFDLKDEKFRDVSYKDFCIIEDRSSSFDLYKKIFSYLGIPLEIHKDGHLTSSSEVIIINNIIKLIIKIKDKCFDKEFRYLFTSIARSFIFSYEDDKILQIFYNNDFYKDEIFIKCQALANNLDNYNSYELLDSIIEKFNIYENLEKIGNINESMIRIDNLLEIAQNIGDDGYYPKRFSKYLNDIINSSYEIDYKDNNSFSGSVKIMTIHKSKGLEFPICYFNLFYKKFNNDEVKDSLSFDNTYGIITPYYDDGIANLITKELVKCKYNKNNISERIRLLYVALTRAKEKMIIIMPNSDDEKNDKLKINSFSDIFGMIKNKIQKYYKEVNLDSINISKDYYNASSININNKSSANDIITIKQINMERKQDNKKHASKESINLITKKEKEIMEKGIMMHEVFEMCDFNNISGPYKNILLEFKNKLNIKETSKVYKEHEFIYEYDDNTYHGIIDLLVKDEKEIKIVDYKLSNTSDKEYLKQLEVYYNYVKSIYNDYDIKVYLYSISKNELTQIKR